MPSTTQNTVIRRIQFGAKNILCDNKDNNQLKDKKLNNNGKHGVENVKSEVTYAVQINIRFHGNDISWKQNIEFKRKNRFFLSTLITFLSHIYNSAHT